MATWKCYRATLRADSPLHIGWHRLGFIERTRYYIAARNIWGATAAALAGRFVAKGVPEMYREGERLAETAFRPGPFFAVGDTPDGAVLRPEFREKEGLRYGDLPPFDFESRYVYSQTATSIAAATQSAEEGALHESEYLAARRIGCSVPLQFRGYVFVLEPGLCAAAIEDVFGFLTIGGERRYGWGRISLDGDLEAAEDLYGEFSFDGSGRHPVVRTKNDRVYLPAHAICDEWSDRLDAIAGELETMTGRVWQKAESNGTPGSGQAFSDAQLCWTPGTRIKHPAGELEFDVLHQGLWAGRKRGSGSSARR